MKRTKLQGFTLVELIVVIAIIGVLAGLLVPSILGYVAKANRRADMANAKTIYNDIQMVMLDESDYTCTFRTSQDGKTVDIPFEASPAQSFYKHNTAVIDAPTDGSDKSKGTYKFVVVAKMDGARAKDYGGGGALLCWTPGNNEAQGFVTALNMHQSIATSGNKNRPFGIKLHSSSYEGHATTRWLIGYRKDSIDEIEIWVCQSKSGWGCGSNASDVIYRLYPEPADPYK